MKKIVFALAMFSSLLVMSCDYDDSNDIDLLTPNEQESTSKESN